MAVEPKKKTICKQPKASKKEEGRGGAKKTREKKTEVRPRHSASRHTEPMKKSVTETPQVAGATPASAG